MSDLMDKFEQGDEETSEEFEARLGKEMDSWTCDCGEYEDTWQRHADHQGCNRCEVCTCWYHPDKVKLYQCGSCEKKIPKRHLDEFHVEDEKCLRHDHYDGEDCYRKCSVCSKVFCRTHELEILSCITEYRDDYHDVCKECFFSNDVGDCINVSINDIMKHMALIEKNNEALIEEKEELLEKLQKFEVL